MRRSARRLVVAGTVSSVVSDHVKITYTVQIHGHSTRLTKTSAIARHAFRTSVTLSRRVASIASGRVSVSYAGDAHTKNATRTTTVRRAH